MSRALRLSRSSSLFANFEDGRTKWWGAQFYYLYLTRKQDQSLHTRIHTTLEAGNDAVEVRKTWAILEICIFLWLKSVQFCCWLPRDPTGCNFQGRWTVRWKLQFSHSFCFASSAIHCVLHRIVGKIWAEKCAWDLQVAQLASSSVMMWWQLLQWWWTEHHHAALFSNTTLSFFSLLAVSSAWGQQNSPTHLVAWLTDETVECLSVDQSSFQHDDLANNICCTSHWLEMQHT